MGYLIDFTIKQIRSCLFPALIFIALGLSKIINIPGLHRYDLLFYSVIIIQFVLIKTGYETWPEIKVIFLFHLIGLALEIYKINIGSWSYPEAGFWKILNAPLYAGFMYSSVGSYIYRASKELKLKWHHWPAKIGVILISAGIYLNFFTHHFFYDYRYLIILGVFIFFRNTFVEFELNNRLFTMNARLSFLLIGIAMWVGENIASFLGAWVYPNQAKTWHLVHLGKITSWGLLIILSIALVYYAQQKEEAATT